MISLCRPLYPKVDKVVHDLEYHYVNDIVLLCLYCCEVDFTIYV